MNTLLIIMAEETLRLILGIYGIIILIVIYVGIDAILKIVFRLLAKGLKSGWKVIKKATIKTDDIVVENEMEV